MDTSVERAKDYISGALAAMLDLGKEADLWITDLQLQENIRKKHKEG